MIVTEELDLRNFKAWSGGKDRLDVLIDNGHWKDAQDLIEELYPDGIEDGQLNDWLWFEAEDQYPGWFFDYSDMEEAEEKVEELGKSGKPWFEADGGSIYHLETEREGENDPQTTPTLKLQAVEEIVTNAGSTTGNIVEIEYDFSDSFEDNLARLKEEMLKEDVLPALPAGMEYVEGFPCWASTLLMYGDYSGLKRDDIYEAEAWQYENGYGDLSSLLEETHNSFDKHPAFGLACETETAVMSKMDGPVYLVVDLETDKYIFDDYDDPNPRDEPGCGLLVFWDEERAKNWLADNMTEEQRQRYAYEKVYDPKKEESNG